MTNKTLALFGISAIILLVSVGALIKGSRIQPQVSPSAGNSEPPELEAEIATPAPAPLNIEANQNLNSGEQVEEKHLSVMNIAAEFVAAEGGNAEDGDTEPAATTADEPTAVDSSTGQSLTPLELALRFQSALNELSPAANNDSSDEAAARLVSVFAELPENPEAEAALAEQLATAYVQSSNADEKSALLDLLMIIPSGAAVRLGETLSRSGNPEEQQIGIELVANGSGPGTSNQ